MPMTDEPDEINDADRLIEATIYKEGQRYADNNQESKKRNKSRAEGRDNVRKLGMNTNAFATAVKHIKDMTEGERRDWKRDYDLTLKVLGKKQQELFPEEAMKAAKREDDRKRKAKEAAEKKAAQPRSSEEMDEWSNQNPRSNPDSGGASPKKRGRPAKAAKDNVVPMKPPAAPTADDAEAKKAAEVAIKQAAARQPTEGAGSSPGEMKSQVDADEQAEGAAILSGMAPETAAAQERAQSPADAMRESAAKGDAFLAEQVAKHGLTGGTGMGSVSDERPLSQSAQAAERRAAAKLN